MNRMNRNVGRAGPSSHRPRPVAPIAPRRALPPRQQKAMAPPIAPRTKAPPAMQEVAAPPVGRRSAGAGRMLMVSVFVLAALVGGGAAGMFLAVSERQNGITALSMGTDAAETAIEATVAALEKTLGGVSRTEKGGNDTDATAATAPKAATYVQKMAPPPVANDAKKAKAAADPEVEQLKALTDQVVATLGGLNAPKPATEMRGEDLQARLAHLVRTALAQGKSDEEIRLLVEEALADADEGRIQGLVRDANGKIDIRHLIAAILPDEQAVSANLDSDTRAYFKQLSREAHHTVTDEAPRRIVSTKGVAPLNAPLPEETPVRKATIKPRMKPRLLARMVTRAKARARSAPQIERTAQAKRKATKSSVRVAAAKRAKRRLAVRNGRTHKRRKSRRNRAAAGRKQILQAFRARHSASRVTPTAASPANYRKMRVRSKK